MTKAGVCPRGSTERWQNQIMKLPIIFAALLALIAAAPPARADYAADKKLLDRFQTVLKMDDVTAAQKLVGAPNFRPLLRYGAGHDTIFEQALLRRRAYIARLMMNSAGWKTTKWNARNTAAPLNIAAGDAGLFPLFRDLASQPHFDANTPGAADGKCPLREAARADNLFLLRWMTERPNINWNARDGRGQNALFVAGALATEILVTARQLDINARDNRGWTALHQAVDEANWAKVRVLLNAPALDPNLRESSAARSTPLDMALRTGNSRIVALLLASPRVQRTAGQRASFVLISQSKSKGDSATSVAPENIEFLTKFHDAMMDDDLGAVSALIAAPKFRPTMQDYGNYTIFEAALHLYKVETARLIMASPRWKATDWNASNTAKPLLLAASDAELLPILKDLAAQPNFDLNTPKAQDGEFPLLRAARRKNMAALRWLAIQPGVDVNKRDNLDRNVLFFDVSLEARLFLVQLPTFDVNSRSMFGDTALYNAVNDGEIELVRALLANPKTDPNIRDKSADARSPLDLALRAQNVAIAALLMADARVEKTQAQRALFERPTQPAPQGAAN